MQTSAVILVIYTLAAARLTGLVSLDTATDKIRDRFVGFCDRLPAKVSAWMDDRPNTAGKAVAAAVKGLCWFLANMIICAWCAGVWICFAVAPLTWYHAHNPWVLMPALALAMAQVVGMTSKTGR